MPFGKTMLKLQNRFLEKPVKFDGAEKMFEPQKNKQKINIATIHMMSLIALL